MTIWNKTTISALAAIVLIFIITVIARPVVYIGGLIVLEIVKPRTVFFKAPPDRVWENGFEVTADVPCNRLYERNIYVRFDRDLPFQLGGDLRPEGHATFRLAEGDDKYEMPIMPLRTRGQGGRGSSLSGDSIAWLKPVTFPEYPVLGGFKCKEQQVYLKLDKLNFDPREYDISITIQRIGIDG